MSKSSDHPENDTLGPTGVVKTVEPKKTYDEKHPNAGNIGERLPGPTPTDDPDRADRPKKDSEHKRQGSPID